MIDDNRVVRSVARAIDGAISRAVQGVDVSVWNPGAEFERFRGVREKTLATLGQLTIPQASWSPGEGKWSILQIADHILRSEEMFRDHAQRLLEAVSEGKDSVEISLSEVDVGFKAIPQEIAPLLEFPMRMFNLFVPHVVRESMIRHPIVGARSARSTGPGEGLTLPKLRQDLAMSLDQTDAFLSMPLPRNLDELTINHPVMGNNTIPQLLRLVIAHEQRHQEQMENLQAHSGFPRVSREPMSAAEMADLYGGGG
jgi:uncharacterized damage-inducible protein DinB